jgi:hypothetical protein
MARGGAPYEAYTLAARLKEVDPMSLLTINFHGICVHFKNVLPGIPHRVVLPDAMAVRFGTVSVATQPDDAPPAAYYLLPHYAFLRPEPTSEIAGDHTRVLDGVHLQILNPSKHQPTADPVDPLQPFSLRQYAPSTLTYSDEVVMGGRAAAYFDLYGGAVETKAMPAGARYTSVTIETDGPPQLRSTTFPGSHGGVQSEVLTIDAPVLTIANMDFDAPDEDDNVDFLLNYLVARDGIPRFLERPVPGMGNDPQSVTAQQIARKLEGLAERIGGSVADGRWVTKDQIIAAELYVLTASCSNSQWP